MVGTILFTLGVGGLLLDYDGIRAGRGAELHALNVFVELVLIAAGVIALVPGLAREFAAEFPSLGRAVASLRSGNNPPPGNAP